MGNSQGNSQDKQNIVQQTHIKKDVEEFAKLLEIPVEDPEFTSKATSKLKSLLDQSGKITVSITEGEKIRKLEDRIKVLQKDNEDMKTKICKEKEDLETLFSNSSSNANIAKISDLQQRINQQIEILINNKERFKNGWQIEKGCREQLEGIIVKQNTDIEFLTHQVAEKEAELARLSSLVVQYQNNSSKEVPIPLSEPVQQVGQLNAFPYQSCTSASSDKITEDSEFNNIPITFSITCNTISSLKLRLKTSVNKLLEDVEKKIKEKQGREQFKFTSFSLLHQNGDPFEMNFTEKPPAEMNLVLEVLLSN